MFERLLASTLTELRELQANVIIVASVPEVGRNVPVTLARAAASGIPSDLELESGEFFQRQSRTLELLKRMAAEYSAKIVYPHETLCGPSNCLLVTESHPVYVDEHHLSLHGAMLLLPLFDHLLDRDLK